MNAALKFAPVNFAMNLEVRPGVISHLPGLFITENDNGPEHSLTGASGAEPAESESSLAPRPALPQQEVSQFIQESESVLVALRTSDSKLTALSPKLLNGQDIEQRLTELPLNPFSSKDREYKVGVLNIAMMGMLASLGISFSELNLADVGPNGLMGALAFLSLDFAFAIGVTYGVTIKSDDDRTDATGQKRRLPWLVEGLEGPVYGWISSLGLAHFVSGLSHLLIATPIAAVVAPGRFLVKRFFQRKQLKDGLKSLQALAENDDALSEFFWHHPKALDEYVGTWLPMRFRAQIDALERKQTALNAKRDRLKSNLVELTGKKSIDSADKTAQAVRAALESVEERLTMLRETQLPRAEQNLRELAPIQERVQSIVAEWKDAQRIEGIRLDALEVQAEGDALATTRSRYRVEDVREIVERSEDLASSAAELDEYLVEADDPETHR